MRVFTLEGAKHYCRSLGPATAASATSLEEFRQTQLVRQNLIAEGSSLFEDYRACALRNAERALFLSASHYRRALDLMTPSASPWAHVTLYYGALYASHAILGMFGCGVLNDGYIMEVRRSSPGNQEIFVQRIGNGPGKYYVTQQGSHKRFWEIFYKAATSIRPFVDPSLVPMLSPISSSDIWLIEQRNKFNYDTVESIKLSSQFISSFSEVDFPRSLPSALNTQYRVCEGLLSAGYYFATDFGLTTDALDILSSPKPFSQQVRELVYDPAVPDLVAKTNGTALFGL